MQLLINALIAGSFAALMATGLSLVYGVLGIFNMALGQFALVAGYTTWWLLSHVQLPLPVGIAGGLLTCALVSWIGYELFVRPYASRHRFFPIVTTIALSVIIDGVILLLWKEDPKTINVGPPTLLHLFGTVLSQTQLMLIVLTLLFLCCLAYVLACTRLGRQVRAMVEHPHAAETLGIKTTLLHRGVFIVSGVLAGCAGVFQAIDQNITPLLGFPITIKAYAAVIAGGKGSLRGTMLSAYGIALLEQIAIGIPWFGFYIPAGYQGSVALLVIIVFLLLRPQGMFGTRSRIA